MRASSACALAAAEAAGAAAWCVDTAAAYAKDRQQFGRPIGQFQGVKHRCADMLVALEQARAVAWDAALALDDAGRPRAGDLLGDRRPGAVALDAFARIAKDCIQVLGGIGFTWEHDAHLYLRRAMALRQLLGGASTVASGRRGRGRSAGQRRHLTPRPAAGGRGDPRRDRGGRRRDRGRARGGAAGPRSPTPG